MSKRVLVTGSDGFIGTALTRALEQAGTEVVHFNLGDGDISRDALRFDGVSHVFHLAAKTFVPDSWKDPFSFYRVNVMGTVNVLEFCRQAGCSVTLMSTYIYGPPRFLPITEDHEMIPNSPYNHSKALVEELGKFYAQKFEMPVAVLRPFNIYGPGQRDNFLIPSIIRQTLDPAVEQIEVADLEPCRDYLYLDDLVRAILATQAARAHFSIYNIGSGVSYSVEQVIQMILSTAGSSKLYHSRGERRHGEVMDTVAGIEKARNDLGWEPRISFEEGIRRTVAAFQQRGSES